QAAFRIVRGVASFFAFFCMTRQDRCIMKIVYIRCGVANVQRIANLLLIENGKVLLMKKPRRDWYVAPGGKMESGESIYEAAIREFREETDAEPLGVHLKGVYTMMIQEGGQTVDEW